MKKQVAVCIAAIGFSYGAIAGDPDCKEAIAREEARKSVTKELPNLEQPNIDKCLPPTERLVEGIESQYFDKWVTTRENALVGVPPALIRGCIL